jgi:hypothetical protein
MYQELTHCRICGNSALVPLLSLGNLALTGIFPKTKNKITPLSPLELVKCKVREYIGRIYNEMKCRPMFIVAKRVNL